MFGIFSNVFDSVATANGDAHPTKQTKVKKNATESVFPFFNFFKRHFLCTFHRKMFKYAQSSTKHAQKKQQYMLLSAIEVFVNRISVFSRPSSYLSFVWLIMYTSDCNFAIENIVWEVWRAQATHTQIQINRPIFCWVVSKWWNRYTILFTWFTRWSTHEIYSKIWRQQQKIAFKFVMKMLLF